ncbi:MAG: LPP20 family lipoprotein [Candidatus Cloacimonetes bacterium]|nr:LPP20 family lipoprotein [Candidatus Cloacimonadota bacterium]
MIGCSTIKSLPDWINTPNYHPSYFSAFVQVKSSLPHYKDLARDMAANDIAMQISTYIESETRVSETEIMGISNSEYLSNIRSSSSASLKNLSPVESYEDEDTYYVLYRLSKAEYYAERARQRDLALTLAQDLLMQYDEAEEQPGIALPYLLSALDLIAAYLDMDLTCPMGNMASIIYSRLNHLPQLINYQWNIQSLSAVAKAQKSLVLEGYVRNRESGVALANIPLEASSEAIDFTNPQFSNTEGRFNFNICRIDSYEPFQTVNLSFNKEHYSSLLHNKTAQKIWDGLSFDTSRLVIEVMKPQVFLDYAYLSAFQGGYRDTVAGALANLNVGVAAKLDEADYLVKVRIEAKPGKYINNMKYFTSLADIRLSLIDPNSGATINYLEQTNLKSGATTREAAERNAERDAATMIGESLLYRLLYNYLLK